MTRSADMGTLGEDVACWMLRRGGYRILDRNVRVGKSEVDIVAANHRCTVAVEVKASSNGADPMLAVDQDKMDHLWRALDGFRPRIARLDVVTVAFSDWGATLRWVQRAE